jgi:hypothetical protein
MDRDAARCPLGGFIAISSQQRDDQPCPSAMVRTLNPRSGPPSTRWRSRPRLPAGMISSSSTGEWTHSQIALRTARPNTKSHSSAPVIKTAPRDRYCRAMSSTSSPCVLTALTVVFASVTDVRRGALRQRSGTSLLAVEAPCLAFRTLAEQGQVRGPSRPAERAMTWVQTRGIEPRTSWFTLAAESASDVAETPALAVHARRLLRWYEAP